MTGTKQPVAGGRPRGHEQTPPRGREQTPPRGREQTPTGKWVSPWGRAALANSSERPRTPETTAETDKTLWMQGGRERV